MTEDAGPQENTFPYHSGRGGGPPNPGPPDGGPPGGPPGPPNPPNPPNNPVLNNGGLQFLNTLQAISNNLANLNQLAPPKAKKIKVRDPDIFDGTDPKKIQDFLVSCNLHFQDHPNLFADDEKKILFVLSFLKGATISWFGPGLMDPNNAAHWMWDFDTFILELESNFGPHDPISDAKNLLTNLTMKKNSKILKYNVDFWKLTTQSSWNKSALVTGYFSGLLLHLHIEVMRGGKPQTLGALRLKAQDADDICWMQKNKMSHSSRNSSNKKDKSKSSSDNNSNSNSNSNFNSNKSNPNSKPKPNSGNSRNSKSSQTQSQCLD